MKNINFKKMAQYLRQTFKAINFIIGLIVLGAIFCILGYVFYLMTDDKGHCLSEGHGVWDADRQECRQDCLTWRKDIGCIPITEENIIKKEKGLL